MMLEVNHLSIEFHDHQLPETVVNDFSLKMNEGDIVGLVGESGSGKSMTALAIAGLLSRRDMEKKGEILMDGVNLLTCPREALRKLQGDKIGVIFQEPMTSLNPVYRIGWQVEESLRIHRPQMSKEERKQRALEVLAAVELSDVERVYRAYPHQLSGGMRQRVMIAMALACQPKLLIADEPTTALDVTIQAQILKLMNDLKREKGTAILFITHDLGVINEMADDVAVMYCGQVVEMADVKSIFGNHKYLHPYTEGLLYSIPRLDTPAGTRLEAIPGSVPHPLDLPKGCKFAPRCKYCTEKCKQEEPQLTEVEPGHKVRCFYPEREAK